MITVSKLARLVGGTVRGDGTVEIHEAATLKHARAGEIALAVSADLVKPLAISQASAAVVPEGFPECEIPLIVVDDVEQAFTRIVRHFRPSHGIQVPDTPAAFIPASSSVADDAQVHSRAIVGENVTIGPRCIIHAGVVIGDGSTLDEDVTLFPNVVLYENTRVGARVTIHGGAVIGAYGFGYRTKNGRHHIVPQLGHVQIEADVEIGACTTIDRGTYDATIIGEGTKIDNQVMIGHNCRIGRHNLICSLAGIAGSCSTGDYVVLAGQSGLSDHIDLGDGARVAAKSGVMQDIPDGETFAGLPAMPEKEFWRMWVMVTRLPELRKQCKTLERELQAVKQQLDARRDAA